MCRHLAYLGPPVTLSALVTEPPHGLLHQSYAPRDMRGGGTVNADGFGVGWYPGEAGTPPEPVRYRSERPIWSDTAFAGIAGATRSAAVLAAVRSATVGMPVHAGACAPFADGRWLFSHNGVVRGWPDSVVALAAGLPTADLLTLDAPTDAVLLWALVRHRLRRGEDPAAVLAETVLAVADAAPGSRLNLLLTDGTGVWATAWTHALSVHVTAEAVLAASEPLDERPGWTAVHDRHLVVARPGTCRTTALAAGTPPQHPSPKRSRGDRCATPSSSTSI
ncbi:MAG: ergothioneine biosynthesis protein EgtC [Pseudonocardia sp.]